jgi:hypothetical protein
MIKMTFLTFTVSLALNGAAFAGSYCENKYADSATSTKASFSPQIEAVYNEIKKVQEAGLDPARYVVPFEGEEVTLVQKANNLVVRYRSEMAKAAGEAEGCASAVAPADTVVNCAVKAYAIWATYGLALLLPDRMTNIDVGEIMHGKPLTAVECWRS